MARPPVIALVEDVPMLRASLAERLALAGVVVAGAFGTGEALLAGFDALDPAPDVVLMDLGLPGISGAETTAHLLAARPNVGVLVLTVFEDEAAIFAAVQAGASGYLLKDTTTERLVAAIDDVRAGGAPLSPLVARTLLRLAKDGPPATPGGETFALTPREHDILRLAVRGDTEARIAEQLFLSPHTVRSHLAHIYGKLHVSSRAAAVRVAMQNRLV